MLRGTSSAAFKLILIVEMIGPPNLLSTGNSTAGSKLEFPFFSAWIMTVSISWSREGPESATEIYFQILRLLGA